jgi:NitT/TauT family transport system substrate-binding protein
VSGLKLFGKTAFYVRKPNGEFLSFLRRGEAEAVASETNGKVFSFEAAVASFRS